MRFSRDTAEVFVPDGTAVQEALARTTHLVLGAHPDDIEIMALEGVLACFGRPDAWLLGVVITDGAGSARENQYAHFTDAEMMEVRRAEQKKAAVVGEYSAQVFLDYPSATVKDPENTRVVQDIRKLLEAAQPEVAYIHNLADKHPTHVACALRCITAMRSLPPEQRPSRVIGCEVWRGLDWMRDSEKVIMRLDERESLAAALVGVFDSQVAGGKRYDLATLGRRRANATYLESHAVDQAQMVNFGMDLTPLAQDDILDVAGYVLGYLDRFRQDVADTIARYSGPEGCG